MFIRIFAVVSLAFLLSACATVTRGSNQAWQAESEPSGARVETSNGFQCSSTPCAIRMPRRSEFVATFTKEGYRTVRVQVTNQVASGGALGMAGNVLVGGIIGAGVDVATGATLEIVPNPAHVVMEPLAEGEENIPVEIEPVVREPVAEERDGGEYDPTS
jgi:hypothetical protein